MLIGPLLLGNKGVIAPCIQLRLQLIGCAGLLASGKRWQLMRCKHHPLLTGIQLSLTLPREVLWVSWIVPPGLLSAYTIIIFCALYATLMFYLASTSQFIMLSVTKMQTIL